MKAVISLFLIVSLSTSIGYGEEIFYVHPNGNSSLCPTEVPISKCLTLNEYVEKIKENSSLYAYDVTYYFLPGCHNLSSQLEINQSSSIKFQGIGNMVEGPSETMVDYPTEIQCDVPWKSDAICFKNCNNTTVANFTIRNCQFRLISVNIAMRYLTVQSNTGQINDLFGSQIVMSYLSYYGGNFYDDYFLIRDNNDGHHFGMSLHISHTNIANSVCFLYISSERKSINVRLDTLSVNRTLFYLKIQAYFATVHINKLVSFYNQLTPFYIYANNSDGSSISITNSTFANSTSIGLAISLYGNEGTLHINSSVFRNNSREGLLLFIDKSSNPDGFNTILYNLSFDGNILNSSDPYYSLFIHYNRHVSIIDCSFTNNNGSAIGLFDSRVKFQGHTSFINNTALSGGGIYITANSYSFIVLSETAQLYFIGNHAVEKGGAIYVEQIVTPKRLLPDFLSGAGTTCFLQLKQSWPGKYLHFKSNTAGIAGSVLYGGNTTLCSQNSIITDYAFTDISTFFNQSNISIISSNPREVCFCSDNGIPDCSKVSQSLSASAGKIISFAVAVVGQLHNTTVGIVTIASDSGARTNQDILSAACTKINYTIKVNHAKQKQVEINITLGSVETNFISNKLKIIVNIEPCLPGTYLSMESLICECNQIVIAATTSCNPVNGVVTKEGTSWVGIYDNCTLVYSPCPYDYCNQSSVNFSLSDPDMQCNPHLNRVGLLCGGCAKGLSLMFGSNKCGNCTNDYLAFIIPFSLAGIVLVILIIALNLTVTTGTINGLLFFTNVVKIYQSLFFGTGNIPVLKQFIYWINLDFGIETCFIANMNSCVKIGLQFVFPFYLWFLIILIILLSRRFSKLSRLIGNNAVPTLCTLLLLSYTKLLLTVVSIFTFSKTSCTQELVWFIDGTVSYYDTCHLVLFIIAWLIVLILFVPYTFFLLLFPLWELSRSKWMVGTSLYLKLKPFFDAYAGPYTDLFRVWPGLLLVARIILSILISLHSLRHPSISVTAMVAIVMILIGTLSFSNVYKNPRHKNLEIFYLLVLLGTVLVLTGQANDSGVSYTFNGAKKGVIALFSLAFVVFCSTVAYHVYSLYLHKCFAFRKKKRVLDNNMEKVSADEHRPPVMTTFVPELHELREPLLEDT